MKLTVEQIASIVHNLNKEYCEALGDDSQLSWNVAPEWQKRSAIDGVKFHIRHPEATDSASHDNWLKEKISSGWNYGTVKDAAVKTHPCIVPFNELPMDQQIKDALFRTTVHTLIKLR